MADGATYYEYRSIRFTKTPKGFWFFEEPPRCGGHWSRYAVDREVGILDDEDGSDLLKIAVMHNMIDRMISGTQVYTGDIRYRLNCEDVK
jgi:hypothetical protein